ncbi:MAG: hypothetical protein KDJ14_17085 [Xanthomonadales bacterium]|nr:hypothetical protein [Xanthomonadales bacterium]
MMSSVRWTFAGWVMAAWTVVGLGAPGMAAACSCASLPTVQSEVDLSTHVFRGKVLQSAVPVQYPEANLEYTFRVDEVWKGSTDSVQVVSAGIDGALCGRSYEVGVEYVVFTSGNADSSCSRTKKLSDAQEELAALGDGQAPETASAPLAIRHARFDGAWYDPERPGEGVVVDILEDGRAALYWYTYSPDGSGEQVWLVGVGSTSDNLIYVPEMFLVTGGQFGFGFLSAATPPTETAWGIVSLDFMPDGTATLYWTPNGEAFGLGRATLQRIGRPPAQRIDID